MNSDWDASSMVEVKLKQPDDFLKVRETLTRIGVASRKEKKLYQSCHILHKQGRYYIVHFKELFLLDGKNSDFSDNDLQRRNPSSPLWLDLVDVIMKRWSRALISQIKILPHKEKGEWNYPCLYRIQEMRNVDTELVSTGAWEWSWSQEA